MRRTIAVVVFLCGFLLPIFADSAGEDVVYLKDGSVLRGTIKSLTDKELTIVTGESLEFTVPMSKVDRFERKAAGSAAPAATPAAAPMAGTPMKPLAVEANLLGFLQFGPFVRLHIRLFDNLYLSPHVRIGYAGALGWILFDTADIGAGTSILYFLPSESPNRFYFGTFTDVSYNLNQELAVNLGANLGYRWRFTNGSYLGTGVIAGASFNLTNDFAFFFGMFELSWGVEL